MSGPVNDEALQIPGVTDAALHGVREFGEWGVSRWTSDYLNEPWNEPDRTLASSGTAQEEPPRRSLREITLNALAVLIDRASALASGPRQADCEIKTDFSPCSSSDPSAFDDRTALDTVLRLHTLQGLDVKTKGVTWSSSKPWQAKSDWSYEVSGTTSDFIQNLVLCCNRLAALLPKLEGWSYTVPEPMDAASQVIGYAVVASKLGEELMSGSDWAFRNQARCLGDNVMEALYPSWRRARDYLVTWGMDEMVGLGFKDFLKAYLARMLLIFKFGLDTSSGFFHEGGYPITQTGRNMARSLLPNIEFRDAYRWRNDDEGKYLLTVPFQDFVALFERASLRFLQALDNLPSRDDTPKPTTVATRVVLETSTFGIFAPEGATYVDNSLAERMVRQQAMPQISLPGVPRVLYCLYALQEAAAKRGSEDESPPSAALLSLALLVHEHFHALAETAPGTDGLLPRGPRRREDWAHATPLNEALAAWMEAHAMRELAPMLGATADAEAAKQAVWSYIRSGDYPAWPYRGAERVQAIHDSEGIAGVRRRVNALRQDPAEAQRAFDQAA